MGGYPASDGMGRLDACGDLLIGHDRHVGRRRFGAEIAGYVQLDDVDAFAQAKTRHATHFVRTVDRNAEALLMKVQAPTVAEPSGHGQLRAGGQQARPVRHACVDACCETFSRTPMPIRLINSDEPPALTNGSGIPLVGIRLSTTLMFTNA